MLDQQENEMVTITIYELKSNSLKINNNNRSSPITNLHNIVKELSIEEKECRGKLTKEKYLIQRFKTRDISLLYAYKQKGSLYSYNIIRYQINNRITFIAIYDERFVRPMDIQEMIGNGTDFNKLKFRSIYLIRTKDRYQGRVRKFTRDYQIKKKLKMN